MLMLDSELAEERQAEIVARARELVERGGGSWQGHETWGRRKLAYEIDKKGEAHYHLLHFDCEPGTLDELTRVLRITDGAMRHMAVRRPAARRVSAPDAAPAPQPEAAAAPE
jgi:small subunit ribosomal protein S6